MERDCGRSVSWGSHFAFVGREFRNRPGIAEGIPEKHWKQFRTRAARKKAEREKEPSYRPRRTKENRRRARAAERGWEELQLVHQWVAEVPYEYGNSSKTYRLVIRRQLIEHKQGQQTLFTEYRYRYVVTNLPKSWTSVDVIDATSTVLPTASLSLKSDGSFRLPIAYESKPRRSQFGSHMRPVAAQTRLSSDSATRRTAECTYSRASALAQGAAVP